MLAMCDRHGRVHSSVPGLARLANVPIEDCRTAIRTFLNPDPDSRTSDKEGRRIEEIEGGWKLINHAKYRDLQDLESQRESKRQWAARQRQKKKEEKLSAEAQRPVIIQASSVNINHEEF